MRIVGGRWKGTGLTSPAGRVRPTAEDVRGEWLSALEPDLPGAHVLELYAGTGALGLEALSRGAARCDFVENNPSALHALKANVAATRCRDRVRIFKRDALQFVELPEPPLYDLAIADPPYGSRQLDRVIEQWLREPFARILSVEHSWNHDLPAGYDSLDFGETRVTTYRLSDSH